MSYLSLTLRVLVVDDHPLQRAAASELLRALGVADVFGAPDGVTALAVLRQLAGPVDILVCNLDPPGIDGVELIRHVAAEGLARSLIVSGAMSPVARDKVDAIAGRLGLRLLGFISQPLTAPDLQALVAQLGDAAPPPPPGRRTTRIP